MNKSLIIISLILLMTLSACQSVKDGLSGDRKNKSDEFLVQKKSPLAVPPDFQRLPKPGEKIEKVKDEKLVIQDIIKSSSETTGLKKTKSQSIEKFIIDKIKED
jgi:hypothetical protein